MTFGKYPRKRKLFPRQSPPKPIETNVRFCTDQQIPHSIAVRTLSSDTKMKPKNKIFVIYTKDEQNGKTPAENAENQFERNELSKQTSVMLLVFSFVKETKERTKHHIYDK